MIFETLIKENRREFISKVIAVSRNLGIKPEWLMFAMWFETGHSLNHRIRNKIGATGLLQFMPDTAKDLGTTTDQLRDMSNIAQLSYVEQYLEQYKGRYHNFVDLYCAVFYPVAIGQPDTYTITRDIVARQNPIFDINHDLDITKAEIKQALLNQIPKNYKQYFV
jgi:hypothetical protein